MTNESSLADERLDAATGTNRDAELHHERE
jgi:hypothetical protein